MSKMLLGQATVEETMEEIKRIGVLQLFSDCAGRLIARSPRMVYIYRQRYFGKGAEMVFWQGTVYRDDRVFILDLQLASKGDRQVWAVTTRGTSTGFRHQS